MTGEDEQNFRRALTAAEKATVKNLIDEAIRTDFPDNYPLDKAGNPKFSKTDELLCRLPLNDLGNSQRLLARYGETVKYVENIGWHGWTGTHWSLDEGYRVAQKAAHLVAQDLKRELLALISFGPYEGELDDDFKDRIGKFRKFVNNSGNGPKLNASIQQAQPYVAISHDTLDTHRYLVTVENGTIDLAAVQGPTLRAHRPDDLISKKMNVKFDRNAPCPVFKRALEEIQPDAEVREFLQRLFGYMLTGDVSEQVIVMFYGATASNGKSTLMDFFSWLMGGYASKIPIESLMAQDRTRSGSNATPDIARLPARRFVTAAEPEAGEKFSERLIKLISGEDKIMARNLNEGFFEFSLQCKLIISFNERPGVRGGDEGFWRRVLLVPFTQQFKPFEELDKFPGALERDPELAKKLEFEAPGILNWMIEGFLKWRTDGLKIPAAIRQAVEEYKTEANNVIPFVEGWCLRSPNLEIAVFDLYDAYCLWAKQSALPAVSGKTFGSRLGKMQGILRKRKSDRIYYAGLSLKEFASQELLKSQKKTSQKPAAEPLSEPDSVYDDVHDINF